MITRILVPLDGSKHADKALDWAIDLAEKYGASIELLTVIPLLETFATGIYSRRGKLPFFGPTPEEMRERAENMLKETFYRAKRSNPNLEISTLVLDGRPSDRIVDTAKEGDFDLIVMESRGLGGAKEFFLGSVADRVACEAKTTVVIVK
ncbi:universal stress protein [Candidatus Bathyarchaeota archaeon]|nr:universal stress protein [Candidatus Bathyarchaeota archaeon]